MKKNSKVCIIVNVSCGICVLLVVLSTVAFYIFVMESHKADPGFCTRKHAAIAMECAKKDDELGAAAKSLNHTDYLLRTHEEYKPLMGLCKATLDCARQIKCKAIRNILNDMSICGFVYYYTKEFSECATKLYEKKDEIECLSEIYNKKARTDEEACKEWKTITPCVKNSIKSICDDKLGILQFKWEDRARKADSIYCRQEAEITPVLENIEE